MKVSCREVEEKSGFECNRVCRKPMSCGRHKCQVKCCVVCNNNNNQGWAGFGVNNYVVD